MKIKLSTFYAFRIIYQLHKGKDRVVTSREISEKEKLSQGVTLKLLKKLEQAGICCPHQGRGEVSGGFSLVKGIDEITVLEVVKILDGMDICANLNEASRQKEMQMFRICSRINGELEKLLSNYTVRDLFEPNETGSLSDTDRGNQIANG